MAEAACAGTRASRRWTLKASGPAYDESRARKMYRHVSNERVVSADRDFIDRKRN
jgi:hypothetical protein